MKKVTVDAATSTLRAGIANALASALIVGIDECASEGRPLQQLQQIYLARGAIMAFAEAETSSLDLATWGDMEAAAARSRAERTSDG